MILTKRAPVIAVEGNIGAGKSTLCRWIRKNLNCEVIDEASSSLHPDYARDPQRWGFTVQMDLLTQRVEALRRAHEYAITQESIIFLDRSILGERAFANANRRVERLSAVEFEIWSRAYNEHLAELEPPDIYLYLEVDVITAAERATLRDGGGDAVDREYMVELHYAHERAVEDLQSRGAHVMRAPWGVDRSKHEYNVHADIVMSRLKSMFNNALIEPL